MVVAGPGGTGRWVRRYVYLSSWLRAQGDGETCMPMKMTTVVGTVPSSVPRSAPQPSSPWPGERGSWPRAVRRGRRRRCGDPGRVDSGVRPASDRRSAGPGSATIRQPSRPRPRSPSRPRLTEPAPRAATRLRPCPKSPRRRRARLPRPRQRRRRPPLRRDDKGAQSRVRRPERPDDDRAAPATRAPRIVRDHARRQSGPCVAIFDVDDITLTGAVPDQAAKDRLQVLAIANAKPGQGNIANFLTINPDVPRKCRRPSRRAHVRTLPHRQCRRPPPARARARSRRQHRERATAHHGPRHRAQRSAGR